MNLNDRIQIPKEIKLDDSCLNKVAGYKKRYGILFSNYYVDKSYSIDYDKNNIMDTIAVLTPFYSNDEYYDCYPKNAEYDNSIIIISKTINNKSELYKIYKNCISTNGSTNNYEELIINKNSFIISSDSGNSDKFYSKLYISFSNSDFYIDSLRVESWGTYQYKKSFLFKKNKFMLSKYKRSYIDSIRTELDK